MLVIVLRIDDLVRDYGVQLYALSSAITALHISQLQSFVFHYLTSQPKNPPDPETQLNPNVLSRRPEAAVDEKTRHQCFPQSCPR